MKKYFLFLLGCNFVVLTVLAQMPFPLELDPYIKPIVSANGKKVKVMKVTCVDERTSKDALQPRCNETEFHFDRKGKLITERQLSFTGERTRMKYYSYDTLTGRLLKVLDSARISSAGQYDVILVTYSYDSILRTVTETHMGGTTPDLFQTRDLVVNCYSAEGKVTCVKSKLEMETDTLTDTLIYDAKGRLNLKITKGRSQSKYKYSKDGRLIEKISWSDGKGVQWHCEYDEYGFITAVKQYFLEQGEGSPKSKKNPTLSYTWNYSYAFY